MRLLLSILAVVAWCAPANAHDFWLQPKAFWIVPGAAVPTAILVGHGAARQSWAVKADRVKMLRSVGPDGAVDHRAALRGSAVAETARLGFASPGTHVVAFESSHAESDLPAKRFNEYLKEEGLTPALRARERSRTMGKAGREIYSRRAKTLVQVGPPGSAPQPHVTAPLGLTLEIVPERNPYTLAPGEALPVRVVYEGRPLGGALIKLTNLDFDARPVATILTDRAGRAAFKVPRSGSWLLNVVWTKPVAGDRRAEFDTTFSSLTFGFPAGARGG